MMGHTTGNHVVDAINALRVTGDIVPHAWFRSIRYKSGKRRGQPHVVAIIVLAHIVGWHQPVFDQTTKKWKRKFPGDRFRFQRQWLAAQTGYAADTISSALTYLVHDLNAIKRDEEDAVVAGRRCRKVVFATPVPEVIALLSGLMDDKQGHPAEQGYPVDGGYPDPQGNVTPLDRVTSPPSSGPRYPLGQGPTNIVQQGNNTGDNTTTATGGGGDNHTFLKSEPDHPEPSRNGESKLWKSIQDRLQDLVDRWKDLGKGKLTIPQGFVQQAHAFCQQEDWFASDLLHVISAGWIKALTQDKPESGHDAHFYCRKLASLQCVFRSDKNGHIFVIKAAQELGHEPRTRTLAEIRQDWDALLEQTS